MRNVRKPRALRFNFFHQRQRLLHRLMHGMRRIAQRVQDHVVEILQQRQRRFRYRIKIREIRAASEAEPKHGHFAVHQRNGRNLHSQQLERAVDFFQDYAGHRAQFRFSVERVGKSLAHNVKRLLISVYRHGLRTAKSQRPQIIESHYVVGMAVRQKHRLNLIDARPQCLGAKVRSRVDQNVLAIS